MNKRIFVSTHIPHVFSLTVTKKISLDSQVQRLITLTKSTDNNFLWHTNVHVFCPYFLQSFMKFYCVVSEGQQIDASEYQGQNFKFKEAQLLDE